MSLRRMILGDSEGQTAFQKMKAHWDEGKAQEELTKSFAAIANPLKLKWGDKLEIFDLPDALLEVRAVESCAIEGAAPGDPKVARYHLAEVGGDHELYLEAICGDEDTEYALYEMAEEFEFDEEFMDVLDNEATLRQTFEDDEGADHIDFAKENDFNMDLRGFHKDGSFTARLRVVAYFHKNEAGEEEYLSVEVNDRDGWISLHLGKPIRASEITSYGG